MPEGMGLILVNVGRPCAVCQSRGKSRRELKERQLAWSVDHRRELYGQGPVVHDFQHDRSTPAWLDPRRSLMHAETNPGVRAPTFNQSDQVTRDVDFLKSHREHEITRVQGEARSVAECVPFR